MSFFTRKLEAQLRLQQIAWCYLFKTEERKAELEDKAGTHLIPLLLTPDKWLIQDTIAIGPGMYAGFGKNVCEVNGVGPDQSVAIQADFKSMLDALAVHFAGNDFLLGSYYQSAPANIAADLAGEKHYEFDYGYGTTRARTKKRLNFARLHVQDALLRAGVAENADVQGFIFRARHPWALPRVIARQHFTHTMRKNPCPPV
jgi:hypothetical protein